MIASVQKNSKISNFSNVFKLKTLNYFMGTLRDTTTNFSTDKNHSVNINRINYLKAAEFQEKESLKKRVFFELPTINIVFLFIK